MVRKRKNKSEIEIVKVIIPPTKYNDCEETMIFEIPKEMIKKVS